MTNDNIKRLSGKLPDARLASFCKPELTELSMRIYKNECNAADGTFQIASNSLGQAPALPATSSINRRLIALLESEFKLRLDDDSLAYLEKLIGKNNLSQQLELAVGDYRQTKSNNYPLEAASFFAAKDGTMFKFGSGLYTREEAETAAKEYNEYIKMRDLMSILLATTEPSSAQMLANGESNKKIREWLESIVKEMVESARSTQTKQMLKDWVSRYPDLAHLLNFREAQIDHLKSSGLELGDTDSYTDETIAKAHDDLARIKKVKADISQARQDNVWYKIASGIDLNPINDIKEAARHLKAITSLARDKWDWPYDKFSVRV